MFDYGFLLCASLPTVWRNYFQYETLENETERNFIVYEFSFYIVKLFALATVKQ
jgi:hypothetical protein